MQVRFRHWLVAFSAAIVAHAGLVLFFYSSSQPTVGAMAVGLSGIEIALGPVGGAPGATRVETELTEVIDEVQQPLEVVEPEPEPVKEAKTENVVAEKTEIMVEKKSMPQPKPKPVTKTTPVTPVPQLQSVVSGVDGKSGTKDRPEAGDGDTGAGGGVPGTEQDYLTILSAWLERHKQYPSRAQRRQQEGTVYLRFIVDREGKVLTFSIERSSGYLLLDREVEKMIHRAAPLPAMPDDMTLSQLELVVPVSFTIH